LPPFSLNGSLDSLTSWSNSTCEWIWPHIEPVTTLGLAESKCRTCYLRVVKDIHGYFFAFFINGLLNVKSPQESRNANEGTLFCKCLSNTDSSTPSECHVSTLIRERSLIRTIFQIPFGIEFVWLGEVLFISMYCPQIPLHPGVFWNEPPLAVSQFECV
jgi:hypothetical protein